MRRRRHFRDFDRPNGLVQLGRLFLVAIVAIAAALAGLAYYGSTLTPSPRTVEKTLPDSRFPH